MSVAAQDAEKAIDNKDQQEHLEYSKVNEVIVDSEAKGYTDPTLVLDDATNRRIRKLINKRVLPCMIVAYLCQTLDKGTLGTASIMGLQADTGMVGQDYALTSTLFWIGVIAGEFPANRLVQTLPLGKFLGASLSAWGITLLITSFLRNVKAIFGLRVILGIFESVSGPVLLAISVMWYKRSEQPLVVSGYQTMIGTNSIITGILGYGFYHVSGQPLYGWQYMMIAIASFSIIAGVIVGIVMPDSPPRAKCFSEADKLLMVERVRANDQGIKHETWNQKQLWEALTEPYIYLMFILLVLNTIITGGLGSFTALLINQAFGFDVLNSQLLTMPLGALSVCLLMSSSYIANRTNQTFYVILGLIVPNFVGSIVLITVAPSPSTKGGLLVAYYCMQCFQAQSPLLMSLVSRNNAGQTKKVFAYGAAFIGWAGGNAIGSQVFQSQWAPRYINSLYIHLGIYIVFGILLMTARFILASRNKKRDRAMGDTHLTHLHAFEDLTDRENPDFRYSL